MTVELTEAEALVITMYLEIAKSQSNNSEAKEGFDKIIQKLNEKSLNNFS